MERYLFFTTIGVGVYIATEVAKRKGLRTWAYGLGAVLVGIVAVPWALIARPKAGFETARVITPIIVIALVAYVGLTTWSIGSAFHAANRGSHVETINSIMQDDDRTKNLRVRFIHVPLASAAVPLLGPAQWNGYFTVKKADGTVPPECEYDTFDYEGRVIEDDNYALWIDGPTMAKLNACN